VNEFFKSVILFSLVSRSFFVANEAENFRITLEGSTSDVLASVNSDTFINGAAFATQDRDTTEG